MPLPVIALAVCLLLTHTCFCSEVFVRTEGGAVVVGNGRIEARLRTGNGYLESFLRDGRELLAAPAYLDWHTGRTNHLSGARLEIVRSPDLGDAHAEVAFHQTWSGKPGTAALDVSLHYVILPGETALRMFAVFAHPASYPDSGFGQSRFVLRLRDDLFDTISVDDARTHALPPGSTRTEAIGPKESLRFLEGPMEGAITDKYHYFVDAGGHFFHGWIGSRSGLGCWIVQGSNEDQNGGPTKQHNSAHFGRILLKILSCGHYGASGVAVDAGTEWRKLYGPWMLLANEGDSIAEVRADAARAAHREREHFPPDWLRHPEFPGSDRRAAVSGHLQLSDATRPEAAAAGAWVGLAAPEPDWQRQSLGYQHWARADAHGRFQLRAVRPGRYSLYAFTEGVPGEFRVDEVEVAPGADLELGGLPWVAPVQGRVLWQIGTPDRSAGEFRHGDNPRRWGLWNAYARDFPDDVRFVVGRSDPRTDWNFAHGTRPGPDGAGWVGTDWTIEFEIGETPTVGEAVLRFGFAAAHNASLEVLLDGKLLGRRARFGGDNALARAGIHGQFSEWVLPFDAALLTPGRRTLTLRQTSGGAPFRNVMYDYVRMEAAP